MDAFCQRRTWKRARRLGLGQLACLGRHTVAGMICATSRQAVDWSADYRLFARDKWEIKDLFVPVVRGALQMLPERAPLVVAIDDTRVPKRGRRIPGVHYGRDPMSPPFHVNLTLGQRFVQLSAMVPGGPAPSAARGVPVRFHHQPPVPKPKPSADAQERAAYRAKCRENNLSTCGRDRIRELRQEMDLRHQAKDRILVVSGDGSYTNKTVLGSLPERTTFIGRIRRDAKLHYLPRSDQQPKVGSKRRYGDVAPRPEELLKDKTVRWQRVTAFASGTTHSFRAKEMSPVLWRKSGANQEVRIAVVAPVGYRLRKGGKLLYRQPAFLICTNLNMPIEELLQYYLWRWDIEVNHRDEKQLIGVGHAQVWSPRSVDRQPAMAVASYAYLLLAALRLYGSNGEQPSLPTPKWQASQSDTRISTQRLLQLLRSEIWAYATEWKRNSSDFVTDEAAHAKCPKSVHPLESAVILARAG